MRCEAKYIASINEGSARHGHVGGHVLHGGAAAAGPPVVAHSVAAVVAGDELRPCRTDGGKMEVKRERWRSRFGI